MPAATHVDLTMLQTGSWPWMLSSGVATCAAADRLACALLRRTRESAAALLAEALSTAELEAIGAALFRRSLHPNSSQRPLFDWEAAWFGERLPEPPATLLLGGAGCGRELRCLSAAGYAVDAFERDPKAARCCEAILGPRDRVRCLSYQVFARTVLDRDARTGPAHDYATCRYDAVIFGWASFHHLLDRAERELAIRASDALCPAGPLMISYWPYIGPPVDGRVERAARRLGRGIRKSRGLGASDPQLWFTSVAGFAHSLASEELKQLAQLVGRRCVWGPPGAFAHVAFVAV